MRIRNRLGVEYFIQKSIQVEQFQPLFFPCFSLSLSLSSITWNSLRALREWCKEYLKRICVRARAHVYIVYIRI